MYSPDSHTSRPIRILALVLVSWTEQKHQSAFWSSRVIPIPIANHVSFRFFPLPTSASLFRLPSFLLPSLIYILARSHPAFTLHLRIPTINQHSPQFHLKYYIYPFTLFTIWSSVPPLACGFPTSTLPSPSRLWVSRLLSCTPGTKSLTRSSRSSSKSTKSNSICINKSLSSNFKIWRGG